MNYLSQNLNLSFQERERSRVLSLYITQYNQTNRQIQRLYNTLDEIRNNINTLIQNPLSSNPLASNPLVSPLASNPLASNPLVSPLASNPLASPLTNNNNINTNINMNRNQRRQRNRFNRSNNNTTINSNPLRNRPFIYYDYDDPINPSTYIDPLRETNNNFDITNLLSTFLNSTVDVRPTEDQINNASRLVIYSDIQNPNSTCCAIRLEPFISSDIVRQIHFCGHIFFPQEFSHWFQNNVRCPVCRYDIRTNFDQIPPLEQIPSLQETSPLDQIPSTRSNSNNTLGENDDFLSSITNRLFTNLLNYQNNNSNDRIAYDPSNNILMYETIIRRSPS
jgi:hypothetical protein